MNFLIWILVWILALQPWWAMLLMTQFLQVPGEVAYKVICLTFVTLWTPMVLLVASILKMRAQLKV